MTAGIVLDGQTPAGPHWVRVCMDNICGRFDLLWPEFCAGQAMGMGASHPQQLQSIPESPHHGQATLDGVPGNHPNSQLEHQGDGPFNPATSQVSHPAADGIERAGHLPLDTIRYVTLEIALPP